MRSKNRNKSQNILNVQTNINFNPKYKKNLYYSIIDGSSSDLKKNNSYISPSSNKKKIKIKPLEIDIKNIKTFKRKKSITNNNSNTISCANNINSNNSNIIKNPYNIDNIISSEEGEQDIKIIFSKKNNLYLKKNINYILNKSHSELKLRLKDNKNNYSSNKVCHQKKKISLVDDIINNVKLFNKDNKNKNIKNLKVFTGASGGDGKGEKNVSFSKNQTKNCTQNFLKNNKKKVTLNKVNLRKFQFKTKTEIICKKKKMINLSSNNFINKNKKDNNKGANKNNSFKKRNYKLFKKINNSPKSSFIIIIL